MTAPLAALLGAAPPDSVDGLPEAAQAELAELITTARRRQTADLARAFDAALTHIPFPLRGLVRKVLTT